MHSAGICSKNSTEILIGKNHAPIWPSDFTGSITGPVCRSLWY
ncbi:hypothetical protein ACJJIE_05690 [Microbulbifer sp. TRSA001]